MTITLIAQYYRTPDPNRQLELDTCLRHNLANELITRVHLLTEEEFDFSSFPHRQRIAQTVIAQRLTFEGAFHYANEADPHGRLTWILANADIWFDRTLSGLADTLLQRVVFALTRHDIQHDGSTAMVVPDFAHGSQDAWIFKTPIPVDRMFSSFFIGMPGCDNRIAHEFITAGYKVINPSLRIIAHHLDLTRASDIFERNQEYLGMLSEEATGVPKVVPPPYQYHLYPVDQTDPDAFEVYRTYMHHLSAQYALICRQAEQITNQGRVLADLYREIERLAMDRERLRTSWSWKLTRPLRRAGALFRRGEQAVDQRLD